MGRGEYALPRCISCRQVTRKDSPLMDAPRRTRFGLQAALSRRQALHAAGGGLSSLAGFGVGQRTTAGHPGTADRRAATQPSGTPVPTPGEVVPDLAAIDAVMA